MNINNINNNTNNLVIYNKKHKNTFVNLQLSTKYYVKFDYFVDTYSDIIKRANRLKNINTPFSNILIISDISIDNHFNIVKNNNIGLEYPEYTWNLLGQFLQELSAFGSNITFDFVLIHLENYTNITALINHLMTNYLTNNNSVRFHNDLTNIYSVYFTCNIPVLQMYNYTSSKIINYHITKYDNYLNSENNCVIYNNIKKKLPFIVSDINNAVINKTTTVLYPDIYATIDCICTLSSTIVRTMHLTSGELSNHITYKNKYISYNNSQIYMTNYAFMTLRYDSNTLVSWGNALYGGECPYTIANPDTIITKPLFFVVIKKPNVYIWGNINQQITNIMHFYSIANWNIVIAKNNITHYFNNNDNCVIKRKETTNLFITYSVELLTSVIKLYLKYYLLNLLKRKLAVHILSIRN
jgi:hypothetical protein